MAESDVIGDSYHMGKRIFVVPGMENVRAAFQTLRWPDYMICALTLLCSMVIGIYVSFFYTPVTAKEYFLGKKKLKIIPVGLSICASFISGFLMIKIPTDTYLYGIQHVYLIIGFIAMTLVMNHIFLPVLYRLNLTSVYEYLEKRFDKKLRLFGAVLYIIYMLSWLPLTICIASTTFVSVTELNINFVTPVLCTICIFYTSLGGLKAVIWTDVFHMVIIFASLLLITVKGTLDIGHIDVIVDRNLQSGRIEGPNLNLNLSETNTLWTSVFGGCMYYLFVSAINQNVMQKYLALPSLKDAIKTSWLFVFTLCLITMLCTYCGIIIYAMFHQCDPLTTKLAAEKNQVLALFVMKVLSEYSGMSGLFIAGIWSGTLSSWATVLNSVTAVVVEDIYTIFSTTQFREKQWSILLTKFTSIVLGIICACLAYTVNNVDTVLKINSIIFSVTGGPSLGLFIMGIMFPWINTKGVFIGGISSLCFMAWLIFNTLAGNNFTSPTKSLATTECRYHFVPQQIFTDQTNTSGVLTLGEEFFQMSYLWHPLLGVLISVLVGFSINLLLDSPDPRDVDPRLLAPFVKKYIKPREFPNEPGDGIIYAFDSSKKVTNDVSSLECMQPNNS
ncbi:putative sodium-dependent multivitamin transporter isoform X1 [Zophobas morio]|uniref:putative sodium-dependent multivitamin transporter isoform X1 n=1 Tax=Zophobas morio TaxID=2755281 RepID=UPI0030838745